MSQVSKKSGERIEKYSFPLTQEQLDSYAWNWDEEVMNELLAQGEDEVVFFCGGAHNESKFFDKFKLKE